MYYLMEVHYISSGLKNRSWMSRLHERSKLELTCLCADFDFQVHDETTPMLMFPAHVLYMDEKLLKSTFICK